MQQPLTGKPQPAAVVARQLLSRLLPRDAFGRQAAIIGAGTAIVQALGVLAAPALTRLYEPADFGVMAAFGSVAEVLVLIATLKYDLAIPITADDRDAARLLSLSTVCVVGFSVLLSVVVMIVPRNVFAVLSSDERLYAFRWFLVLAILGGGLYAGLAAWATRRQHFVLLSSSRAYQSVGSVTVQLGAGVMGAGLLGLILGAVSNMTSGIWMLWRRTARDLAGIRPGMQSLRLPELAHVYCKYPLFTMPTALLNQVGRSAPTVLISSLFGASVTGFYSLGLRVVGLPSAMVSAAMGSVFLSRVPEAIKTDT